MSQVIVSAFRRHRRLFIILGVMSLLVLTSVTAFAQTPEPPNIDLDISPLFDSMNNYIPLFLTIFAIPGGIVIAIALVRMLINLVQGAFKGAGAGK